MFFPIGDDQIRGGKTPIVSYGLIALNVLFFFYEIQQGSGLEAFLEQYGSVPAEITQGQNLYTLFSSMFLHAGWGHLLGNMVFLWIFADNIEAIIGNIRFLIFYILGGLAAHALHIFTDPDSAIVTVGASGAISAVMGAYLVMFPRSRVRILFLLIIIPLFFYVPAFLFLGLWIYMQFASGFGQLYSMQEGGGGVAYWAHIGGFVFGVLAGFLYRDEVKAFFEARYGNTPVSYDR